MALETNNMAMINVNVKDKKNGESSQFTVYRYKNIAEATNKLKKGLMLQETA